MADININLNVNSDKYESSIKKAEKATDKFNDELKDIPKTAKKAENALDKVSDEAKKLEKSAKAGRLGVEALKDKLGALPVVGQTLSRSLDGVEGSFLSVAKAALPVAGIAGGLAAVGGAALLAYKNSEKLQGSIGRLGAEVVDLGTNLPIFESIGDALAVVTDNIADVIHNMNIINGTVLEQTRDQIDKILSYNKDIEKQKENQLKVNNLLGASEEENLQTMQNSARQMVETGVNASDELIAIYDKAQQEYNNAWKKMENAGFTSIEALKEGIKELSEEAKKAPAELSSAYGASQQGNSVYGKINNLNNILKEVTNTQQAYNDAVKGYGDNNRLIEKSAEEYKELGNTIEKLKTVEGIRSTDKNKNKKETEDELSEVEKLKIAYDDLVKSQNIRDALIDSSNIEEVRQKEIQDTQAQITALENLYEAQVKAGEPAEETLETIKQLKDYLNDLTKETLNWKDHLTAALSITSSIGNLFGTAITAALDFSKIDLAPFDKAIEEARSKLDAFNKWKEEQKEAEEEKSLEDYEERIALLDEEIEYAKEIGDKMSEIALENKKKEIQKEMEEEQKRIDKEKAINEEEKRLQQELALAEYNKEYANWQNQVKSAQTQKTKAIADSIIMPAQAIGNAALGVAQAFAQGGLVGLGLGIAASTGVIASAVSGAAGVKNASSALDSIQGNPPQPPQFQFGTAGYNVSAGESILVGEAGPELLSLKSGGNIAVESNAQVKAKGLLNNGGMYIDKVIFNVNKILNEEEIYKAMNNYKQRNSFMYTR